MDEQEFTTTCTTLNDRPCVFAKALLRRCAQCSRSRRFFIAERETVGCNSPASRGRCQHMMELFRQKFLFALRLTQLEGTLPHGKEMKVECGGLIGLQAALGAEPCGVQVADINALLEEAEQQVGLDALPFAEMTKYVTSYQHRARRR